MIIELIKNTAIGAVSLTVISSGMIFATLTTTAYAGNGSHYDEDPPGSITEMMEAQEEEYLERKFKRQCPQLKRKCERGTTWACRTYDEYCDD